MGGAMDRARERARFVGRRRELDAIIRGFEGGARLLTVVGTGGCGKTRLARRLADEVAEEFAEEGGIVWCDLTEARTMSDVVAAVALQLGLSLDGGGVVERDR